MTDSIIVAILVVAVFFGIRAMVKHFARKGGCCGSADYKPKKKKLKNMKYQKTFRVEGMHCERCKARVEDELIKSKLERVGYTVVVKKGK